MLLGSRGGRIRCLVVWCGATAASALVGRRPALRAAGARRSPRPRSRRTPLDVALDRPGRAGRSSAAPSGCGLVDHGRWSRRRCAGRTPPAAAPAASRPAYAGWCWPRAASRSPAGSPSRRRPRVAPGPPHRAGAVLAGLPLPDRAVATVAAPTARTGPCVVRPGDTLWSIAAGDLPAGSPDAPIAARWHAIYARQPRPHRPRPRPDRAGSAAPSPRKGPVMSCTRSPRPRHRRHRRRAARVTPVASVQGTLALDLRPAARPRPSPRRGPARRSAVRDVVPVDLVQRRRFEQHAARIGAAVVRSWAATGRSPSCCAGRRPRSTRTSPAAPTWSRGRSGAGPAAAASSPVRPQVVAAHTCFVSGVRRGQPARALRRPLPRPRRPVRADPALAVHAWSLPEVSERWSVAE